MNFSADRDLKCQLTKTKKWQKWQKMTIIGEKFKSTTNNLSTSRTAERHARGQKNVERRGKSDLELEKFSRRFFFLFPPLNFDVLDIECLHVSTIHFQGWGGEGEEWVILHYFLRSHGSQTFQVFFDWLLCYHQTSSIVVRKNYFLISKMEEIIVCSGHPTVRRRCSRGVVQELKEAQTHLKGNWK